MLHALTLREFSRLVERIALESSEAQLDRPVLVRVQVGPPTVDEARAYVHAVTSDVDDLDAPQLTCAIDASPEAQTSG